MKKENSFILGLIKTICHFLFFKESLPRDAGPLSKQASPLWLQDIVSHERVHYMGLYENLGSEMQR